MDTQQKNEVLRSIHELRASENKLRPRVRPMNPSESRRLSATQSVVVTTDSNGVAQSRIRE